jgi:hypothetical protein
MGEADMTDESIKARTLEILRREMERIKKQIEGVLGKSN